MTHLTGNKFLIVAAPNHLGPMEALRDAVEELFPDTTLRGRVIHINTWHDQSSVRKTLKEAIPAVGYVLTEAEFREFTKENADLSSFPAVWKAELYFWVPPSVDIASAKIAISELFSGVTRIEEGTMPTRLPSEGFLRITITAETEEQLRIYTQVMAGSILNLKLIVHFEPTRVAS